jgi:hypothetical protein
MIATRSATCSTSESTCEDSITAAPASIRSRSMWWNSCWMSGCAAKVTALGVEHVIKVYPGAGHGSINDHDPADAALLLTVLSKVSGTLYHEPSARDAAAT